VTTLTAAQVAALVKKVGFPDIMVAGERLHVVMVAIARQESGFKVEVVNSIGATGLFQILTSAHRQYDPRQLRTDAEYNTKAAYEIYQAAKGLRPWVAYTSGAYKKYLGLARQGVAAAGSVVGNPSLPGATTNSATTGAQPTITYGSPGPSETKAGVGTPLDSARESLSPLAPLRILGSEMWGDYSTTIIGTPTFEAGIETVPHLRFTIADPGGDLLSRDRNVFVKGARVQYLDLDMRIDEIHFEPGGHGTGQITVTAIDDIVYRLMNLTGPQTASGWSAVSWLHRELFQAGLFPSQRLLGEAVLTQSEIVRDVPDQSGTASSGSKPSSWTTQLRLARELGKRCFISGTRIVFGSSAFAMRWCAPGSIRLALRGDFPAGERWLTMPTAKYTTVGDRSDVLEVTGRVPLNRALYFRPGVSVTVFDTPAVAGAVGVEMMCAHVTYELGTDVDGADVTLVQPVDPPAQPPSSGSANSGPASNGQSVSGGGADGQVDQFVALALQQAGKRYIYGVEVKLSDPNPSAFDCSELVQWAASRAGITPEVPDGSAAQLAHCRRNNSTLSIPQAINTKGALLFMNGHVAISLGNGSTIEAMNPSNGVRKGKAAGRAWIAGAKIPGAKGYR
jgi:cell wall-associated NlpC family hydrolase